MSGSNLHVFTLKFLALKTTRFFPHKKNTFHNFFDFCLPLFNANFQFKKKFELFFVHKNFKKRASKLLKIGPDPFISQSRPDHSPQPRIDFSYYEISGPDICSLICDTSPNYSRSRPFYRNEQTINKNASHIETSRFQIYSSK